MPHLEDNEGLIKPVSSCRAARVYGQLPIGLCDYTSASVCLTTHPLNQWSRLRWLGACMKTATILATVILLAATMLAQAGVIYEDDFNRPPNTIVGNGWVETEFGASDARMLTCSKPLHEPTALV